jgi:microsomal dipeptidase-like Zn-dependent dipeptidase
MNTGQVTEMVEQVLGIHADPGETTEVGGAGVVTARVRVNEDGLTIDLEHLTEAQAWDVLCLIKNLTA